MMKPRRLKKGDKVFDNNGNVCEIAEDYDPDMTKNHNGRIHDTNGIWWLPCELMKDMQGELHEASCAISKDKENIFGTVFVNTYTGDIYIPTFHSSSMHSASMFLSEKLDDFIKNGDGTLIVNGVKAPFYKDGKGNLYCFPSDLKPRPSLNDILSDASSRSGGSPAEKPATSKGKEH